VNRLLMRACFRVHAEGLEHLPAHGNYVIAPNHASYLDPFAIAAVLDHARLRRLCWAGWTGAAFRGPLTRTASRLGRAVPIDPDRAVISSLALAAAVLNRGDGLVWFPEGSRSTDGSLQALRPGIGILLEHHAAMVVPTHIEGSHEAMPVGSFLPRPHRIHVTFGQAVSSEDLQREGKGGELSERITGGLEKRLRKLARHFRPHLSY
jgi:long-chain acyl-CoA synthetase